MESLPRTYVPLSKVSWRVVLSFFAIVLICLFVYRQLDYVANGVHRPPLLTFLEEFVGCLAGFAVFPLCYSVVIRFPLPSSQWRRNLCIQLGALCLISVLHTTLIALLRALILPAFGYANNSYGYLPVRYPMEFAHLFIFYWAGASLTYLFHEIRFARQQEIHQAQLRANLAEAQLRNLRLQLEPHFLFNALNAISAAIYEDPAAADQMICRLADLLRHLVKNDQGQEVSLQQELENLELYVEIMQARLEQRLRFNMTVAEDAAKALVPQLVLQPLVENAIRHGMDPLTFAVDIAVSIHRRSDVLHITIWDAGPGIDTIRTTTGVGLRNTKDRLRALYGENYKFEIRNAPDRGAIVEIQLPFRVAEEAPTAVPNPASPEHALT